MTTSLHLRYSVCIMLGMSFAALGCTESNKDTSELEKNVSGDVSNSLGTNWRDNTNSNPVGEEEAVQAAWDEFKEASLSGKGSLAAGRVTTATHERYDQYRLLALSGSKDELETHVLMTRITVLGIRLRTPADELRTMTGRDLFAHAVDQGWIGKNSATDEGIESIVITGDHARANITKNGQPTGLYLHFIKEDGIWRLDMLQIMKVAIAAFDQMFDESGMTEDVFIQRVLETTTGLVVTDDLWVPPDNE